MHRVAHADPLRPAGLVPPVAGRRMLLTALLLAVPFVLGACARKQVSRIDPNSVTDLSGRWNDTDSRLVARALIEQSLDGRWISTYESAHGGEEPTVIVGTIRNQSLEHIPVSTFVNDLERALVSSGQVRLVAGGEERDDLRTEREQQQEHARADTRARPGQEEGADYMLVGEIVSIEDEEGGEKIVYYQVDATLVDLESSATVWAGQHRIKKYVERRRVIFD